MFTVSSSKNDKKDGGNLKENTLDGKENRKKKKSGKSVSRQSDSSKKGRRTGMQVYSESLPKIHVHKSIFNQSHYCNF